MRIIVMSDSHGSFSRVRRIVESNRAETQSFLHLGDGLEEFEDVHLMYPDLHFVGVKGNNDWGSNDPKTRVIALGGKQLLMAHGDQLMVKLGTSSLLQAAREAKAELALYGHTHVAHCEQVGSIYLINPGSVMSGSYLKLDITAQGIEPDFCTI